MYDAYLDIEATGLSCQYSGITVLDMYLVNGRDSRLVQLVGMDATAANILEALAGVNKIYTYNGSQAVRLWWQYVDYGDCDALTTLLEYNGEDVMNLKVLRERLEG